jgi:hypothetical protein
MKRKKLGDIFAIPLPNGKYAFGRLHSDYSLAIYDTFGNSLDDWENCHKYQFFVTVESIALRDGKWPIVGNRPFAENEDIHDPPQYMKDIFTGKFSIYHRGKITPARYEDCVGMERTAVWGRNHVVDRLMGIDKWTDILK